jgi:ubiquinone/menaquinone biosynthesis C-methylase UbiE
MSAEDIFSGTASYYARYRPRIPQPAYDASASAFALDGSGRLLDVGCGTGQVAVALHDRFEQVAAIDVSAQMLNVAREEARLTGATNIDWRELPGEAISASLGTFRLVTCADVLHWMDEDGSSRS